MGGVMERLEVLLIALVLLLAGIVTGVLMFVRPPAPAYLQTVPHPVVTRVALSGGDPNGTSLAAPTPAAATQSPAPSATALIAEAVPYGAPAFSHIADIPLRFPTIWPWMVLLAGLSALPLILIRFRRRRMTYTNQNVEQLLAASDPVTRASNVQIMRGLAEQGMLTSELAAAAGIDLPRSRRPLLARLPQLRLRPWHLPPIALPALRMPATHLPRLRLGRTRWRAAIANLLRSDTVTEAADWAGGSINAQNHLSIQATPASTVAVMPRAHGEAAGDPWTAEERARAAAAVIVDICSEWRLHSELTAVDTPMTPGSGPVIVMIEAHPGDEVRLGELPARLVELQPGWRAAWRRDLLTIFVQTDGAAAPTGSPMLLPVLAHGRAGKAIRFLPLAYWRHLGLYGADALRALHAMLGEVLFVQPPADLALMIIDQDEITPLYRDVAHHMPFSTDGDETLTLLADAIRQHRPTNDILQQARPLLVVVVEPDDDRLRVLHRLITRLRTAPATPVHVLLVQERLSSAGRELYALLPAMITGAGQGSAAWLPGLTAWPKPGTARLVGQKMRLAGRPLCIDDSALAAMVAQLRGNTTSLPSTVWDRYATSEPAPIVPGPHALVPKVSSLVAPEETIPPVPLAFDADDAERPVSCSASQHDQATTLDVKQEPLEQLSHHAALLRAASAAGRADAPPALAFRASRGAPGTDEQSLLLNEHATQALAQLPTQMHPIAEPDNGFPVGPAPLGRAAMAELMARIASSPAIIAGQANEVGVTKNRLVDLLKGAHKAQAKELAEALLAWFDLAGLLAEPSKPGRLRHPRPLTTTSLIEIAERLNATPCPDRSTVQMLWARSNEGRD